MSSLRRIFSSQVNGALSRGPKTPEGKRRSSQNALRHGLLSKCLVLANESQDGFQALLDEHLSRLSPADGVELGLVEEMVAAAWRLRRIWALETRLLEDAVRTQQSDDELGRIAAAFSHLANLPQLALIHRYETRLHTIYQRSLHNLILLRIAALPNEPSPISGHRDRLPDPPPARALPPHQASGSQVGETAEGDHGAVR